MKIRVNGIDIEFEKKTLKELLDLYRFNPSKIVVEKNGRIIDKEQYATEVLKDGDVLEIARFVGRG
ncbi:MAG TPA: sulfur carrier protein ThiS [Spirochaetota bacterium]|jgi:sulfur carrier protein|nr:sulfur carrier protein ThiS [Spirochaetota bacterium]HOF13707.1 sulfur carrier protein ThiS [Spirochaetota bacterium]HOR93724.1 sulfur carrier protein ThiS [Spirochaetota bacterium]HOT19430.1 sulfur carrier protein ThiS [Spirochaetota bacterium]HPD05169.1 sulfur carrier protein ThiS [Spirochaetota bacterium]